MSKGKCLCGSVAWEITEEPFQAFNCHCKMCRKAHGSAFGTYWFLRPEQFHWTSDTDTVVIYRSSHLLTRSFCGTCGSVVPYPNDAKDHIVALGGCHDHGKKSDCNIFVAYKSDSKPLTRRDISVHSDDRKRFSDRLEPQGPGAPVGIGRASPCAMSRYGTCNRFIAGATNLLLQRAAASHGNH